MITFRIGQADITLDNLHWVDARFVVADHPETGKPALFLREDEYRPYVALNRLGMRFASGPKTFNGIRYYDLEVNDGSEMVEDKDSVLHREPGDQGVQSGSGRDVVSQGARETSVAEVPEEPAAV